MLPRTARLTTGRDFTETVRGGRRAGGRHVVVHLDVGADAAGGTGAPDTEPARAGFVVARTVGGSVTRNRVKRRLRHLVAARLRDLPPHARVVVRALPAAAGASAAELDRDLRAALERAVHRPARRGRT